MLNTQKTISKHPPSPFIDRQLSQQHFKSSTRAENLAKQSKKTTAVHSKHPTKAQQVKTSDVMTRSSFKLRYCLGSRTRKRLKNERKYSKLNRKENSHPLLFGFSIFSNPIRGSLRWAQM
jgi:hypothetical protein